MKTNIALALGFVLIISILVNFLNNDYQSMAKTKQLLNTSPAIIDTSLEIETAIKPPLQDRSTIKSTKTIQSPKPKKNALANSNPQNQDDRILFNGLDFSGITNFKITDVIDDNSYLPTKIFPIYGPARKILSVIRIGTSDQGDVYFNGYRDNLEVVLRGEKLDIHPNQNIVVFTLNQISIEVGAFASPNHPLNIVVDNQVVAFANLRINQIPACAETDTRKVVTDNDRWDVVAQPCTHGYKELNINNLIEIKDENFYKCITANRDTTVNLGNPRIKKGWVNKYDVLQIACPQISIKNADEIDQFPNLQTLIINSDFPNVEKFNNLRKLKYLGIFNFKSDSFDVRHIRNLNNLVVLTISNTTLISPTYLANLEKLKTLILTSVTTENYEFAKFLNNVEYFDISNNKLDNFPDIGFKQTINTIRANSNNFENIYGFEEFINLEELLLRNNNIYNIDNLDLENSNYIIIDIFGNPVSCNQKKMRKYRFLKVKCDN